MSQYQSKPMSARALAVYQRTYSRGTVVPDGPPHEDDTRTVQPVRTVYETFPDTINRVIHHQRWLWARALGKTSSHSPDLLAALNDDAEQELSDLRDLMLQRQALPTGRTMWLGGTEIARTRELSQFACSGLIVKTVYDMVDVMWLLLNGVGVGAKPQEGVLNGFACPIDDVVTIRSTRTEKGGVEVNLEEWDGQTGEWRIRIGDSGEAWAKAIGKIMAGKYPARRIVFDYSQLRPEGSLLSRYGWRSSGDTVISRVLPKIAAIMSRRAGQLLRKCDILDVVNLLGVIQTGRRGAEIGLMDEGDPEIDEFTTFKAHCYEEPFTHRQQSNNSILFWERPTRRRLADIFDTMERSGGSEPGFINAAAAKRRAPWFATANPCVEILLADKGFCNLFEVDVSKFTDAAELHRALRLAARANYRQTLVTLDDGMLQRTWHEVQQFLHLCGVSCTGIVGRPDMGPHDWRQARIAATLGAWSMADELGTPRPKNVTCVKPSGTLGKVMDAPGEGAHRPLGRFIFNSVVYNRSDPLVPALRDAGYEVRPHPSEETQVLVKFPVESAGTLFEDFQGTPVNLEPAVDQLERYKMLMENWCDQNVSMTVYYALTEVPAIIDWMLANWDGYVGVSFLYRTDPTKTAADLGYAYLPQEVVTEAAFRAYVGQLRRVDPTANLGGAVELDDLPDDCEGGVCPIR